METRHDLCQLVAAQFWTGCRLFKPRACTQFIHLCMNSTSGWNYSILKLLPGSCHFLHRHKLTAYYLFNNLLSRAKAIHIGSGLVKATALSIFAACWCEG